MSDRSHVPVPLGSMTGGVNRFTEEAAPNQCADALDVFVDDGDLRRRDAFVSAGSAPPHLLPAGAALVAVDGSLVADRRPDLANTEAVLVGCAQPFDGIDLRFLTTDGVVGAHRSLRLSYWNGSDFAEIAHHVDETRDVVDGMLVPFQKAGRLYWHTDAFVVAWTEETIAGQSAFWIQIEIVDEDGEAATIEASDMTVDEPGVRVFVFAPVNGLFPVRIENRAALVIGADRRDRAIAEVYAAGADHRQVGASGVERGAALGAKRRTDGETEIAHLIEDEGPGTFGEIAWPRPRRVVASTGVSTNLGSSGLTYGTTDTLVKTLTELYNPDSGELVPYDWPADTWRGGKLSGSLTPAVTFSVSNVRVTASGSGLATESGFYRHCRIRVTTKGAGGTPLDEEREVVNYTAGATNVFEVYPPWSVAPDANNRFTVFAPHALALPPSFAEVRSWGECFANEEDKITFSPTGHYTPSPAAWDGWLGHFRIGRELRWSITAGRAWSAVVDVITGRLVCTNGESGLLEYDGTNLRVLEADYRTAQAKAYVGALADALGLDANMVATNPTAILSRWTPKGAFVAQHQTRLFVAGDPSFPYMVRWSAPGGLNNVWPLAYEDMIRDEEGDGIVGMIAFDEKLVVFTPTALHEAIGPDQNGRYSFAPLTRGLGFVGNQAVCVIRALEGAARLAGIAADGIYTWGSGEPVAILDRWDRLLDGGVNGDRLSRVVACSAPQASLALFAVPSRGSNVNDRILVLDYARGRWWVWSAPFGVSAMAVDYDGDGRERILFGTNDGFVMTLADAETDDGQSIDAFATSLPVTPFGGAEGALSGFTLSAKTMGSAETLSVAVLGGEDTGDPLAESTLVVDRGDAEWGSATWGTSRWATRAWRTIRENVPNFTRDHTFQIRVSGAVRWVLGKIELLVRSRSRSGR